jgi:hypothetical protein
MACTLALHSAGNRPAQHSPVNQVFQFTYSATYDGWADGAKTNATAYLWIPERTRRLRGLIIMGSNVPEHMLVGHPAIREVCARNDLGILWSTPTFSYFKAKNENAAVVKSLQTLLDGLAKVSSYEEVASVPWLPMGESGHLLMVDALVEAAPERTIAGVWIKNAHLPPSNRVTPALVIYGTAQEWSQDKEDFRTRWNNLKSYETVLAQRAANPNWPLSFAIDGHSGHFDVSERLVNYMAHYIDVVAKARLPRDGGTTLRPVDISRGFLADLPVPGHTGYPVTALSSARADARNVPWYFDRQSAREAQSIASINWNAESQLPAFADARGNVVPFSFNGISRLSPEMEADGITFKVRGVMLDKLPANFVDPGKPLVRTPGEPLIEWLCGAVAPQGQGTFRISLDRTWRQQAIYLAARQQGSGKIRGAVQPLAIDLRRNTEGKAQNIAFDPLPDVRAGTRSIPLHAKSDSGLPVQFFVVAGPAFVRDGRLVFTKVPPRTRYPVSVTVAAWQWGRATEPKIKMAEIVKRTFQILAPGAKQ